MKYLPLILLICSPVLAVDYTLTVTATHGTVLAYDGNDAFDDANETGLTRTFTADHVITLIPRPETGYMFTGWSGDARAISRLVGEVTMDGNKSVTATFATWAAPIGIPTPTFGITQTYRMYDEVGNRNTALPYRQDADGGYYTHYIDPTSATSTNYHAAIVTLTSSSHGSYNHTTGVLTRAGKFTEASGIVVGSPFHISDGTNMIVGDYTITARTDDSITIGTAAGTADSTDVHGTYYNDYGSVAKPIKKPTSTTIFPEGSVVYIPQTASPITEATHYLYWYADGTAAKPVFFRGLPSAPAHIFDASHYITLALGGSYVIIENIDFENLCMVVNGETKAADYFSIRNCEFHEDDGTRVKSEVIGIASGNNFVVYNNHIHHMGAYDSQDESDWVGVMINTDYDSWPSPTWERWADNVWVVDNWFHNIGSDCVQANSQSERDLEEVPNHYYIGRNMGRHSGENFCDLKQSRNVVISQNSIFHYHWRGASSPGDGIVINGDDPHGPMWVIFNEVWDAQAGIRCESSANLVGNVVHHILHGDATPFDATSNSVAYGYGIKAWTIDSNMVNNTVYDCDIGIVFPDGSAGDVVNMVNNIVAFQNYNGPHYSCIKSDVSDASTLYNNLIWDPNQTGGNIRWGISTTETLAAMQKRTGNGDDCIIADPEFVSATTSDFRLSLGSAAIDAGTTSTVYDDFYTMYGLSIAYDIAENPRPVGGFYDMGAYEFDTQFGSDANCVAVYSFESGELTTDSQGTNTLTNSGVDSNTVDYKEGAGSGLWVTANSDYMTIADASLDAGFPGKNGDDDKKFTVTGWFKGKTFGPSSGNTRVIIQKGAAYPGTTASYRIDVQTDGSDYYFRLGIGNSGDHGTFDYYAHDTKISTNTWYHFGVSYQDSDKAYRIHLATASGTVGTDKTGTATNNIEISNGAVYIGSDGTTGFDGLIDELCVFNDILTQDEMIAIKQGVYPNGPIPEPATTPDPADDETGVSLTPTITWADGGGATSYDVYFGSTNPPASIGNQAGTSYEPSELDAGTQYYVKVVAKNDNGSAAALEWTFTTGFPAGAGTYFVDDVNGSDSNAGRPVTQAWKTIGHGLDTVSAGDTIQIRAGTYYESLAPTTSGADGNLITVEAYGSETVVVDTTALVSNSWTQCAVDEPNLFGNTNYANIYKVRYTSTPLCLFEAGRKLLPTATVEPTQTEPWWNEHDLDSLIDASNWGQKAFIVDANRTEADDFWNGCTVVLWSHSVNNWIVYGTVTDFDQIDHKLTVSGLDGNLDNSGTYPDAYAVTGQPYTINAPGEWAYYGNYVYIWPKSTADLTNSSIRCHTSHSYDAHGIYAGTRPNGSYIKWKNLEIRGVSRGATFLNWGGSGEYEGISLIGCYIHDTCSDGIYVEHCDDLDVNDVNMQRIAGGFGMMMGTDTDTPRIHACDVNGVLGTSVYIGGGTGAAIYGNSLGKNGVHGNGGSEYGGSGTLWLNNTLTTSRVSFTINGCGATTYRGNLCYGGAAGFSDWGGGSGEILMLNNTIIGTITGSTDHTWTLKNNILSATQNFAAGTVHQYNAYTGSPIDGYGEAIALGTGELVSTSATLFAGTGDYHLGNTSPAVNNGTSMTSYLSTLGTAFPDLDFTEDIDDVAWSTRLDMGAYVFTGTWVDVNKYILIRKVAP